MISIRTMAYYLFLCCSAYWGMASAGEKNTLDPIGDFFSTQAARDESSVYILKADINNDGFKDMLLSLEYETNARLGNIWDVYLGSKMGFKRLDDPICFNMALYIGKYKGYFRLLSVVPGRNGSGSLISFRIKGDQIIEESLGLIGADDEAWDLFKNHMEKRIEKRPVRSFVKKYKIMLYPKDKATEYKLGKIKPTDYYYLAHKDDQSTYTQHVTTNTFEK